MGNNQKYGGKIRELYSLEIKKDPEGYEVRDYLRCLIQQITMITIPSKRIAPPSKLNTGLEITMFIPSTS